MIFEGNFNPRFRLGESNEHFCDCIGLVIWFLKQEGFKCPWEKDVVRLPTNYSEFYNQMWQHGFKDHEYSNFPVVSIANPDGTGHIGLIHNKLIYHMRPEGLQIKQYTYEKIWYYHGD